jgi:uncharacterized protein (DUF433 family)
MEESAPIDYRSIITVEPGKRSGKPCIRGLRMSEDEIIYDFPELTKQDIRAALAFAADLKGRTIHWSA